MRNAWLKGAVWLLLVIAPLRVQALEARNLFADVTDTLSIRMNAWMAAALEQNTKDLQIALICDKETLCAGESAQMQVEICNPRMHATTVAFQFTLSDEARFSVAGGPVEEMLFLPAARMTETGEIIPGSVQRTYTVTMQPVSAQDAGWMRVTAAASLQEGSRWYQSTQNLTLCAPQISAVLRATQTTPTPQERFFYEVVLTNSGAAAAQKQVTMTLPDGITYTPLEQETTEADEATQAMTALAPYEIDVQGGEISLVAQVPAATYDERGELSAPAQTIVRVPVTVEAQVLDEVESAQRVFACRAAVDGETLQEARVTVSGPIIHCTLTPTLRDITAGETMHYTCRVENRGYAAADVRVTVQIPDGFEFTQFATRGQGNKRAGKMLSWTVHLEKPTLDIAGKPEPTEATISYQVRAQELQNDVRALIVPATAIYQIGEAGQPKLTATALTTVRCQTVMGLSVDEWLLLGWAGVILVGSVTFLFFLIRRDSAKGD